jgi:D-sedoheptulose 7-phosphate isomerase
MPSPPRNLEPWDKYIGTIAAGLGDLAVTDGDGASLAPAEGFSRWVSLTRDTHDRGGMVYIIGNGGSAGMASHMAVDACKNGGLRALAFNDPALLTATANDLSYDQVFSLPLERLGRAGDLVISISSSGNSPNILRALDTARRMGMSAVTLSGKDGSNRSRGLGAVNFYVPLPRYGWVESAHQIVIHYWLDRYLTDHGQGAI